MICNQEAKISEDQEKTSRCAWAALCLVLVLFFGLSEGSFIGALTGQTISDVFGLDHVYDVGRRLLVLAGMIMGLLVSAIVVMTATIALTGVAARLRSFFSGRSVRFLQRASTNEEQLQ